MANATPTRSQKNLQELFPILSVDAQTGIIVSKNADLTIAFRLDLSEIFTISESEYTDIHTSFVRALKVFPAGYVVHKQDIYLESAYLPPLLNQHTGRHFIERANDRHFAERPILEHVAYVYITLPASSPIKRTSANNSLFKRHLVPKQVRDPKTWQNFNELCNQFSAILNDSGKINCHVLSYDELVGQPAQFNRSGLGLYHHYLQLSLDDPTLHDVSFLDGFQVGGKYCHTYSITDLAELPTDVTEQVRVDSLSTDRTTMSVSTGSMMGIYMPYNHVFNQILYIEHLDELVNKLTGEIKRHDSFSRWSKENEVSSAHKDAFIEAIKAESRTVVKAHYNLMVFHDDKAVAEQYRSQAAASIAKLGIRPKLAQHDAEALFWACIPGNAPEIGSENLFTCFVEEAVALWPFETNYKDPAYRTGGIQLTDRMGAPCMVDLIVNTYPNLIDNRNVLVVGPSGTGKSFATNNVVYYLRRANVQVTVVDIGGSYRRLNGVLDGTYICVDDDTQLEFNPFYFADLTPNEFQQDALRTLIQILWKGDEAMDNSENSGMAPLVTQYYAYLRESHSQGNFVFPCMNSFYEYTRDVYTLVLKNNAHWTKERFDVSDLLWNLDKFYKGGLYAYLLNSEKNLDLISDPFTVFELDNIKENKTLYPIVTMMIMNIYVNKLFLKNNDDIKVLIIEEAWQALSQAKFSTFLLWAVKTCRKHNGSLVVVTQEVKDLLKSPIIQEALVSNCAVKVLLDQKAYKEDFGKIQQALGLNEDQVNVILSINGAKDPSRPPYKEMAIMWGNMVKVYGVEVSRPAYAAFTTNKTEVKQLMALEKERGGNTEEAITAWVSGKRAKEVEPV